jgi:glycosyltransferase involved in cell wall biosynthesis
VSTRKLRVAFCLPGLHRVVRGAEVALESIAGELARRGDYDVTVIGSGEPRPGDPYKFLHADCVPRERFEHWPSMPVFRSDTSYEELTFLPGLLRRFDPSEQDIVVTCSYPFLNWAVRARRFPRKRPLQVYVTQNGDWPLHRKSSEFRWFASDGVVCTNPDYFDAHGQRYPSRLIPNGVDPGLFHPGPAQRARFGLPEGVRVILMVSALIPSKRVLEGIQAASAVPGVHLVVAGDGPLRADADAIGQRLLGERYHRLKLARTDMPALYRSADLFLHMSLDEPSANAYIEALATGLPVVTHDRRVTRWTLGEFGTFVDATDLAAVSARIEETLDSPYDRARAATEASRRFSWKSIAGQYAEFFEELARAPALASERRFRVA